MVGLSTAWHLQRIGIDVTVFDSDGVAAGSSWGNAGWLTPGLATPLPEPAVLKYGVRALLSPNSPVYVPPAANPRLLGFLLRFARNSTTKRWQRSMSSLIPLNDLCLEAFDELADGGVKEPTVDAMSFLAGFASTTDRAPLLEELEHIRASGQDVAFEVLDGDAIRTAEPSLSSAVGAAIRLHGQRFIDPGGYVHSLADAVRGRGGEIVTGVTVRPLAADEAGVSVGNRRFDAAVIATGATLNDLARPFGVRRLVQAGRGYSFSVPVAEQPRGPIYLPTQRVACTPIDGRLRVAGMMEFRPANAPLDPRRIEAIVAAARPFLHGADLDDLQDEWVGARPCTSDGLPLIGRTTHRRVFVGGGHGMWGITLGPVTGRLLADLVATGRAHPALTPFDPLR